MAAFLDVCRFNPTAGGTGDWTYSSPVAGYQSPASANAANGRVYKFRAESLDLSQWELTEGAYNSSTGVFARSTVLYNSAGTGALQGGAGAKINFSTVPQVAIVALKEDLISIDEANSFSAAQQAQARSNIGAGTTDFPSGTVMLFAQTSAPTGWTKVTTHNDKALRVVSGSASSGGVQPFSTVFGRVTTDPTTITQSTMASHAHFFTGFNSGSINGAPVAATGGKAPEYLTTSAGGDGAHVHGMDIRVQYVDVILATRN